MSDISFLDMIPSTVRVAGGGEYHGSGTHHFRVRVPDDPPFVHDLLWEAVHRGVIRDFTYQGGDVAEIELQVTSREGREIFAATRGEEERPRVLPASTQQALDGLQSVEADLRAR